MGLILTNGQACVLFLLESERLSLKRISIFFLALAGQLIVFLIISCSINVWLQSKFVNKYEYRVPNLRKQDWFYYDFALESYVKAQIKEHGVENIIVFVGDSVTYGHGTDPQATFTGIANQLVRLGANPKVRVLNIGCDGTGDIYYLDAVKMLNRLGVVHIYVFLNVRDYTRIRISYRDMRKMNENARSGSNDHDRSKYWLPGNKNRNVSMYELKLRRLIINRLPNWISWKNFIKKKIMANMPNNLENFKKTTIQQKRFRHQAKELDWLKIRSSHAAIKTREVQSDTEVVFVPPPTELESVFVPEYGKKITPNKKLVHVSLITNKNSELVKNYHPNLGNLAYALEKIKGLDIKPTFAITPLNEALECSIRKLDVDIPRKQRAIMKKMINDAGFVCHASPSMLPIDHYRFKDSVHFNFLGGWRYFQLLRTKDSFLSTMCPNYTILTPGNDFGVNQSVLPFISPHKNRIQYQVGLQQYKLLGHPLGPVYFQFPEMNRQLFSGKIINENKEHFPCIVWVKNDKSDNDQEIFRRQIETKETNFQWRSYGRHYELIVNDQTIVYEKEKGINYKVRIGYMEGIKKRPAPFCYVKLHSAFYVHSMGKN